MTNEVMSGIVITSREIYDAVVRLTGRVDVLITQTEDIKHDLSDHENRIRNLEKARWPIPAVTALVALFSLVIAVIPYLK
jgi:hypothetical protein